MNATEPHPQDLDAPPDHHSQGNRAEEVFVGFIAQGEKSRAFFEVQPTRTLRELASPRNLEEMTQRVRTEHVLLLGGEYDDKPTLARQVAWNLAQERYYAAGEPMLPVLEWTGTADYASLLRGLEQQAGPSVLVMPGVQPHDLNYDLSRLHAVAVPRGHVVVATTERTLDTWRVDARAAGCWYALPLDGVFGAADLCIALSTGLEEVRARLPPGALATDAELTTTLAGVPLMEIAEPLRTPGNVEIFVQQLAAEGPQQSLDPARIDALVKTTVGGEHRVRKWFQLLGADQQLLALSLALFNELYDDQYFAAVERLVARLRRDRNPRQRAFDYADLEAMSGFVTQVTGETVGTRYSVRRANQRALVLQAAWDTHRRTLLGLLPLLAELAAESAPERGEDDEELFGDDERREQIREAIGTALTEIGLLSRASVQNTLLELAADDDPWVQSVAARAVARWRERGADPQLFDMLREWQDDALITGLFEEIRAKLKKQRIRHSPAAYIRATIAVAVAYASEYDPPGHLHPRLVELLESLAEDGSKLVRGRFGEFTLPIVLTLHLAQLRPLLLRMMRDPSLVQQIGEALAYAYRTNPDEVLLTLNDLHRATEKRPDTFDPRKLTERDKMLLAVVHTYGALDYAGGGPISADQGFRWLQHILATERHPQLRTAAVIAVTQQARHRFGEVEPQIRAVLGEATAKERAKVVEILTELYKRQRAALTGGTVQRKVGKLWLWLWADGPRPRTEVELALLRWMCDAANPAAQQVAVQAFVSFADAVDRPAEAELARFVEERRVRRLRDAAAQVSSTHVRVAQDPGWYAGTFVPWLVTLTDNRFAPIVRGLLPEALTQHRARRETMDFVLAKWQREPGEPAPVSHHLGLAIAWYGIAWTLLVAAALLVIYLLVAIF